MKQTLFGAAALAVGATFALTSCQSDEFAQEQMGEGRHVRMSVSLGFNPDETRTTLTEEDGNLKCTWNDGDKVWVMDLEGHKLGELTILDGYDGKEYAKFDGDLIINDPDMSQVSFVYFGSNVNPTEIEIDNGKRWKFDFKSQKGTLASLSEQDFLSAVSNVEIDGGMAYTAEMGLKRMQAFGHFELVFPAGVTRTDEVVTVDAENMYTAITLSKAELGTSKVDLGETVSIGGSGNDIYMTVLPGTAITPTFTVTIDGKTYTGSLSERTWSASEYVRKSHGVGVPVNMAAAEPEDPNNPGNTDNWGNAGADDANASWTLLPESAWEFSKYGRYTNCLDLRGYGGWSTCFEYSNVVANNVLTSNGSTPAYFQWGRLMGFPSNVTSSPYLPGANSTPLKFGTAGNPGGYLAHYEVVKTLFSTEDSNKYPYVFVAVTFSNTLDWSSSNTAGKWESFSGNPCPDGYRLPTPEEMSLFVPSDGSVSGSKVEYKTIDGVRYAVEWTVVSGTTPYFQVRTAKTNATDVKPGDAIFTNSNAIKFYCYGYLMDNGVRSGYGDSGIYWTNATGNAGDLLDASGNGGQALYFEISGTHAEIMLAGVPRVFGGCVMPIKDETAKGVKYRPWFPWAATWPK